MPHHRLVRAQGMQTILRADKVSTPSVPGDEAEEEEYDYPDDQEYDLQDEWSDHDDDGYAYSPSDEWSDNDDDDWGYNPWPADGTSIGDMMAHDIDYSSSPDYPFGLSRADKEWEDYWDDHPDD